ncbi:MAG: hypothetical protein BA865_11945, partial [Desulfobacterales bacterium S5133MH4]
MNDPGSRDVNKGSLNLFQSLSALRAVHGELLQRYHDHGSTPEFLLKIDAFIRQGQATGALLDDDDDRWAAQSILDYWVPILWRAEEKPPDGTLAEFDPTIVPELADDLCPYRGLDAFGPKNHRFFCGRQRLIEKLVGLLKENRFIAVVGPSGSGKSSLVLAGLLPRLQAGVLHGSQKWRYYSSMVPGSNPLASIARLVQPPGVDSTESTSHQVESFRQDPDYLSKLMGKPGDVPSVLIIDQFEEVFTLCRDDQDRQAFVNNLLGLTRASEAKHIVILTMRTDFESYIQRLPALQTVFEQAQVRVTPLNASELREAIEKPAESVGLKFEQGVVDALLRDTLGEPAGLPLLQFSLLKLWENRERNRVTRDAYNRLGGGRLALARSADEFYEELIPEDQTTAKRILLRLVRPGEGLEVTRYRQRRETLLQIGEARDRIERVLDRLIQARLVRQTEGDTPADTQVEVAHEALVRNWPKLVEWLDAERVALRQRKRLIDAAENWEALGRDSGALLRGSLLDEALHLQDLNELENEFVQVSKKVQEEKKKEKEKQILREMEAKEKLAEEAEARRKAEEKARHEAEQRANEQQKLAKEAEARQKAEEKARHEAEKVVVLRTKAARRARCFAVAVSIVFVIALCMAIYAVDQKNKAEASAETALQEKRNAQQRRLEAEEATREANRQRLISIAQALSLEVIRLQEQGGQEELGVLLARQAYRFNQGHVMDNVRQALVTTVSGTDFVLEGHDKKVQSAAFSPDGKTIASGGQDNTVRVWDVQDPRNPALVKKLDKHKGEVSSLAFSPDGLTLA